VIADDENSGEERTFRVDRIEELQRTGETAPPRHVEPPTGEWFADDGDLPTVTLVLDPVATWAAERYPVRAQRALADGRLEVVLAVASERWLARLLLRLGDHAEVLAPAEWRDLGARTAAAVLARYRA
jgi:proteasome accessory factor C